MDITKLRAYMLMNDESAIPTLIFTKKEAQKLKKDWRDNWDEWFDIVEVKIVPIKDK
jgi:hypothetical protein